MLDSNRGADLCIRDVGSGVPNRQNAALLCSVPPWVEGHFEVAFKASALLCPVAHILLLLLW